MDNADNKGLPSGGVSCIHRASRDPAGGGIRREKGLASHEVRARRRKRIFFSSPGPKL
jgi:hypothetical protein